MLFGEVYRPWLCLFEYKDVDGKMHTLEADEMQTRVLLHELDHLEGISCVDRYEPKTLRFLRQGNAEIMSIPLKVLSEK